MSNASGSQSNQPAQEKPCRACGEKIAAQAVVCHVCSTPQRGPLWLYFWKDIATAIVAVLAFVPLAVGFIAFVWPILLAPQPKLITIVYSCQGSTISLGVVNSGKAFGFVERFSVTDGERNYPMVDADKAEGDDDSLGEKAVISADGLKQMKLTAMNGGAEQVLSTGKKWTLHMIYLNTDGKENSADTSLVCHERTSG